METVFKNYLRDFIETQKAIFENRKKTTDVHNLPLFETRVITFQSLRQTGTTSEIAKMFDPEQDVYVNINGKLCEQFIDYFLMKPCRTVSMNATDIEKHCRTFRGRKIRYVFLDLGVFQAMSRGLKLRKIIPLMDELLYGVETFFIIT